MRKKLFAILMSAMMMVTFMPAMAFAKANPEFKVKEYINEYTQVKGTVTEAGETHELTLSTVRELLDNGMIKVLPNVGDNYKKVEDKDAAFYYDLSLMTLGGDFKWDNISYEKFIKFFTGKDLDNKDVELTTAEVKAVDVTAPKGFKNEYKTVSLTKGLLGYKLTVDKPAYDENSYAAQTFTLPVSCTYVGEKEITAKLDAPAKIGTFASKTIKVDARDVAASAAKFTFDGKGTAKGNNETLEVAYDGAEHTVVMNKYPDMTVTYKVLDRKAGSYVAVDSVVLKDVGDDTLVQAFVKKGSADAVKVSFTAKVKAANKFEMELDKAYEGATVVAGFDAYDLLKVVDAEKKSTTDTAAIAADAATIKTYINDRYEFVKTVSKVDGTRTEITVKDKWESLTKTDKDAAEKKYAQIKLNYKEFPTVKGKVTVYVSGGDIEWVKAPLTKKYYNKSGKLAKTYTFAVEAKAASEVTYSLKNGGEMIKIDKNTGKVTVKKGLKVGTYKVYVTAKAGTSTDTYVMTIKMAKKK